jgi:hypothetical protein
VQACLADLPLFLFFLFGSTNREPHLLGNQTDTRTHAHIRTLNMNKVLRLARTGSLRRHFSWTWTQPEHDLVKRSSCDNTRPGCARCTPYPQPPMVVRSQEYTRLHDEALMQVAKATVPTILISIYTHVYVYRCRT